MKNIPFLGFIPAKKNSKRLPNKHHKLLCGIPIVQHTLQAAKDALLLDDIFISTDDKKIVQYAENIGIVVGSLRPQNIAKDTTPILDVIKYSVEKLENKGNKVSNIVLLQPTSPLRNANHIDQAIQYYKETNADTLSSVSLDKNYPWLWKLSADRIIPLCSYEEMAKQRHENPIVYAENGAIFIFNRKLLDKNTIYGNKVVPFILDVKSSVDIDTEEDFKFAQFLAEK
ncbi:CMP-N-acetlyneuraminic acid synthetase [Candidatus Beckwithbacteria bacterium CG23_combo_of_CG06-09_8_20_14_all_34_8]|uniref:CMP-N-acetlyneuraminic acid synthetase n=1 Tax=Candidatus Beckwithbacteria bacterium CG23_combo_of_CG06-09_8_20_14_all_34_8 TaxID=1974497 RepID=A0A2H0B7T6_9BACT|nr:MAG: CMP-N-acetlyneuraminic acid synthetase [Candidatus Beckwithbacteria bacterium CG23_combo_of_CG06-09_8_20_14_all_34_8]